MKKVAFVALVLVSLTIIGCSSAPEPIPTTSVEETPAAVEPASNIIDSEQHQREYRQRYIDQFNAAFADKQADWTTEVRGTANGLCDLRDEYYIMELAMGHLTGEYVPRLEWSEVGVTREVATKKYQDTATLLANRLNEVLNLSLQVRENMPPCGNGEGTRVMTDAGMLTEELIRALKEADKTPEHIRTTAQNMRQRLLNDFRARIQYGRREATKGPEAIGPEVVINEATMTWHFTPEELGLTAEEVQKWGNFRF